MNSRWIIHENVKVRIIKLLEKTYKCGIVKHKTIEGKMLMNCIVSKLKISTIKGQTHQENQYTRYRLEEGIHYIYI